MQGFVELIGKFPSGLREIAGPVASQETSSRVVEHRQQMGGLFHAQLGMIFAHSRIASIL